MTKRYFIETLDGYEYEVSKTEFYLHKALAWLVIIGGVGAFTGILLDLTLL